MFLEDASLFACRREEYSLPKESESCDSMFCLPPSDILIPKPFIIVVDTFLMLILIPMRKYAMVNIALSDNVAFGNVSDISGLYILWYLLQYNRSILYSMISSFIMGMSSTMGFTDLFLLSLEWHSGHSCRSRCIVNSSVGLFRIQKLPV